MLTNNITEYNHSESISYLMSRISGYETDFERRIDALRKLIKINPTVISHLDKKVYHVFSKTKKTRASRYRQFVLGWIAKAEDKPLKWHEVVSELIGIDRTTIIYSVKKARENETIYKNDSTREELYKYFDSL